MQSCELHRRVLTYAFVLAGFQEIPPAVTVITGYASCKVKRVEVRCSDRMDSPLVYVISGCGLMQAKRWGFVAMLSRQSPAPNPADASSLPAPAVHQPAPATTSALPQQQLLGPNLVSNQQPGKETGRGSQGPPQAQALSTLRDRLKASIAAPPLGSSRTANAGAELPQPCRMSTAHAPDVGSLPSAGMLAMQQTQQPQVTAGGIKDPSTVGRSHAANVANEGLADKAECNFELEMDLALLSPTAEQRLSPQPCEGEQLLLQCR